MKKIIAILLIAIVFTSCKKPAQEVKTTSNSSFDVGLLFEVDGCKVYRFFDMNRYHYFTSCNGSTSNQIQEGKTSREETIQTIYGKHSQ